MPLTSDPGSEPVILIMLSKKSSDATLTEDLYTVTITYPMQFRLFVSWLAAGVSFRQAKDLLADTKLATGVSELGFITNAEVSNYARIVCGINLRNVATILNADSTWAFSLANDPSTYHGKSYLDNRICFYRKGVIHNVHFLAIPMYERHTGEYMFKLVSDVFDVLCPTW
jgi:hypothetical protein